MEIALAAPALRDRFRAVRDRLTASPAFRAWAARFPLTRPMARRRARDLFDLCAGFVYTQVLLACVRLRLFEMLQEGPQDLGSLARRMDLSEAAAARLLDAAVSLRLVDRRAGGRYGLGPLGGALIGNAGVLAMVEHHAMVYRDLADPVALLRADRQATGLAAYWPYAGVEKPAELGDAEVAPYTRLMAASQPMVAEEVIAAYDFRRHRRLLDVGGGDGSFLAAVGRAVPDLRLMLFDLPAVAERARARFRLAGLEARAEAFGGDFQADELPRGADIVSLVRVVHDHDDSHVAALLARVRRALPPGGTVLIAEPMAGTAGAEPIGEAYFGFYLLAMGRGRARRPEELFGLLQGAGFAGCRVIPTQTPLLARVVVAQVPVGAASVSIS